MFYAEALISCPAGLFQEQQLIPGENNVDDYLDAARRLIAYSKEHYAQPDIRWIRLAYCENE